MSSEKTNPVEKGAEVRSAFGNRLRVIRLAYGISQEELAYKAELDRTYVSSVERGRRNIGLENICRLAHALEQEPLSLLQDVPPLLP